MDWLKINEIDVSSSLCFFKEVLGMDEGTFFHYAFPLLSNNSLFVLYNRINEELNEDEKIRLVRKLKNDCGMDVELVQDKDVSDFVKSVKGAWILERKNFNKNRSVIL